MSEDIIMHRGQSWGLGGRDPPDFWQRGPQGGGGGR